MNELLKRICLRILQEEGRAIGNLRLQKLLYFVQAYSLVRFGNPAFESQIQAWPYGPVVPEAYFAFKDNEITYNPSLQIELEDGLEEAITVVVDYFRTTSDFSLVDLTHEYDIWRDKINNLYGSKEITPEEIREFHFRRNEAGGIF